MIKLYYSNEDKSIGDDGWVIYYNQLETISNQLTSLGLYYDKEMIESVLLVANGEYKVLKNVLKELEIF